MSARKTPEPPHVTVSGTSIIILQGQLAISVAQQDVAKFAEDVARAAAVFPS